MGQQDPSLTQVHAIWHNILYAMPLYPQKRKDERGGGDCEERDGKADGTKRADGTEVPEEYRARWHCFLKAKSLFMKLPRSRFFAQKRDITIAN